jgi:murein DD-endopeptidase MepM/ murein hydrolase activator NlpD
VSAEVLREANRIGDVRSLRVGQKLWIPPAGPGSAGPLGVALTPDDLAFRWPLVGGRLTSSYGRRGGSAHEGIDIAAPRGTAVHAAEAGKVVFAGWMNDYGRLVVLKHAGRYRSVYAHLQRIDVEEGRFIERGEAVGLVGTSGNASGPHLHFEIREQDRARDPIRYLP